jgi:predicted Zn-dependent protease
MMWTRAIAAVLALTLTALPAAAQTGRVQVQQAQILREVGGAYSAYVARIGERVAAAAGLPGRCVFTIVDAEEVNAFTAPPGCYVYVTRGLLGILNSEAELAAVLGHELGHVAAKHAQKQQSQAVLTGLAAALVGAATRSDLAAGVARRAGQLGSLSYSRSQEYEADTLAMRYLPQAGYAPRGLPDVLDDLQREDEFNVRVSGREARSVPGWARTHPLTSDRIRRAVLQADQAALQDGSGRNAETYLSALDGLAYGGEPDQGYISGQGFRHPGLGIAFEAPPGFRLTNEADAVRISGPDGLRGEFAAGRASPSRLEDYAEQVLRGVVGDAAVERGRVTRTRINGVEAVVLTARAPTRGGLVEVVVAAYAVDGARAYHFATIAPLGRGAVFDPMYDSFRRLSGPEASGMGPQRIAVVSVRPGDTSESLAARMAGEAPLERFLMLNALERGQPLTPGQRVKLVIRDRAGR